jgi:hypothetical protein
VKSAKKNGRKYQEKRQQKTGPSRARFWDRQRGGTDDRLPREELLAGMHHLLPTGMQSAVTMQSRAPAHNAITGMPAMR